MSAYGRKRKSESSISSVFDVRYTPESGLSIDMMSGGRFRPEAVARDRTRVESR